MAAAGETPIQKQLRIKSGVVTRIEKELAGYHAEKAKQSEKIDRMTATGADEHDIKKQKEVLEETEVMIPDTLRRLLKAVEDLRDFVAANGSDASIADSTGLTAAKDILERHPADGMGAGTTGDDDAI